MPIPDKDTTYWCQMFKIPVLHEKHHVIKVGPLAKFSVYLRIFFSKGPCFLFFFVFAVVHYLNYNSLEIAKILKYRNILLIVKFQHFNGFEAKIPKKMFFEEFPTALTSVLLTSMQVEDSRMGSC